MSAAPDGLPRRVRAAAVRREAIDGVLLLDKPKGLSSNQALMTARRLLGAIKAGHGGTLDPMASGLLPVMLGEATKFAHDLLEADKTYLATAVFGAVSLSGDAEGPIEPTGKPAPSWALLAETLPRFIGPVLQRPPMHSALKHEGRPLYAYAREGLDIERTPRAVNVRALDLIDFDGTRACLRVRCSKGTYIRTLVADIGEATGAGAWLADLRREEVGDLTLAASISLETIESMSLAQRRAALAPLDHLLRSLQALQLDSVFARRFSQGQRLRVGPRAVQTEAAPAERVRVYHGQRLIGVAMLHDGVITPLRLLAHHASDATGVSPMPPLSFTDDQDSAP